MLLSYSARTYLDFFIINNNYLVFPLLVRQKVESLEVGNSEEERLLLTFIS